MLPRGARLTDGPTFRVAVRRGRRCGRVGVVVHLWAPTGKPDDAQGGAASRRSGSDVPPVTSARAPASESPRVGFVVGRGVGPATVRNRVRRRLRHLVRDRLDLLPAGSVTVLRVLPPAGGMTSAQLAQELDECLGRLLRRQTLPRT